jgi:hypothetical protein
MDKKLVSGFEVRNQKYISQSRDVIDCEINHNIYGWIPFLASKNDSEATGLQIYLEIVSGLHGVVAEYVPAPVDFPNLKQIAIQAVQLYLDAKAQERNYDGILSLCSYATSKNTKFSVEGQAGISWRDASWEALYDLQSKIESGQVPAPTTTRAASDLALSVMPIFEWPSS